MRGVDQVSNPPTTRQLQWQCRRGMLELDYLFSDFLRNSYPSLSTADKQLFVRILGFEDQLLLDWLMGNIIPSDGDIRRMINTIRLH